MVAHRPLSADEIVWIGKILPIACVFPARQGGSIQIF